MPIKKAIILLHKIYGVNAFINEQRQKFTKYNYDVYCPNLLSRSSYLYEESTEAYSYFTKNVGFKAYNEINFLVNQLKDDYDEVYILGYSVGATLAWLCCENPFCSGIIACYGSRIRDFTHLNPTCPTLLIFANQDSFDVDHTTKLLVNKQNISIMRFETKHGFLDYYSSNFDKLQATLAETSINRFLNNSSYI